MTRIRATSKSFPFSKYKKSAKSVSSTGEKRVIESVVGPLERGKSWHFGELCNLQRPGLPGKREFLAFWGVMFGHDSGTLPASSLS